MRSRLFSYKRPSRLAWLGVGLGVGAGVTYLLDAENGAQRRQRLVDGTMDFLVQLVSSAQHPNLDETSAAAASPSFAKAGSDSESAQPKGGTLPEMPEVEDPEEAMIRAEEADER